MFEQLLNYAPRAALPWPQRPPVGLKGPLNMQRRHEIAAYLATVPEAPARDIAQATGISSTQASTFLRQLADQGTAARIKRPDPHTNNRRIDFWRLTGKAPEISVSQRIRDYVIAHPGRHAGEIEKALGLKKSVSVTVLTRAADRGALRFEIARVGGRNVRRFYPARGMT